MKEVPAGPHAMRSGQLFQLLSSMTGLPALSAYMLHVDVAAVLVEIFMSGAADGPIPFAGYEGPTLHACAILGFGV